MRQNHTARKLSLDEILDDLVTDGMISRQDAEAIYLLPRRGDGEEPLHPLEIVASQRPIRVAAPHDELTLESLAIWLAGKVELPYHRIDPLKVDVATATGCLSYAYAARFRILPLEINGSYAVIATAEPYVREWEDEVSKILDRSIVRVLANPRDISRYLVEFYALTESVKGAVGKVEGSATISAPLNLEQMVELGRAGKLDANDRYVVNIVDWLLHYAYDQRASDIHLEPRRESSDVRFRIDGVLHPVYQLPTVVMTAVVSRLKVLGRMDVAERRRPQDGRIKTKVQDAGEVELRLSTLPTVFGEKLVMRIFDPTVTVRSFQELGLNHQEVKIWEDMVKSPHGIVLVTGPTGSGKTTTLYSTLRQLARPEVNVCTLENPIEMVEPRFNQMQVQPIIGLDFAAGLRTLLRQDPDIIMVGEIRDLETAEMAVQAALTGHLVLSTLHTNDAVSAVVRLMDVGVPHYLIRATLLGVMAQRLVRTLCPRCKEPGELDEEAWRAMVNPWKISGVRSVFQPRGCLECRETGYLGRVGIYEMLRITPALRQLITPDMDETLLREQAMREGMHPLRLSGAKKVYTGQTTMEEVFRVAGFSMES
ncbi:MAG: GspE/PulE family protein [Syntrophobacteraceae bacterium]